MLIRVYLTDGSVESFAQPDEARAKALWDSLDPLRLFAQQRVVIAGAASKSVFVGPEIVRIDFVQQFCPCWQFPQGYPTSLSFRKRTLESTRALTSRN